MPARRQLKIIHVPPAYCAPVNGADPLPQPPSPFDVDAPVDGKTKARMRRAAIRGWYSRSCNRKNLLNA